jgi:hypothetical protein
MMTVPFTASLGVAPRAAGLAAGWLVGAQPR